MHLKAGYVVRFFQLVVERGRDPAEALEEARKYLRTSTAQELDLAGWYDRLFADSGGTDKWLEDAARYFRNHPQDRPYEAPFHWAGLCLTGV